MQPDNHTKAIEGIPLADDHGQHEGHDLWERFAEPQGYAVKWDGFALLGGEASAVGDGPQGSEE